MLIKDIYGIALSIIGLWLTGAGIIGEKRLRTTESWLRNHIYGKQGVMRNVYRRLFEWLQTMVEDIYPTISKIVLFIALLVVLYGGFYFFNWLHNISEIEDTSEWSFRILEYLCILSLSIFSFMYIFAIVVGILSLPLIITLLALLVLVITWLALLPYIILDLITIRYKLESSLTFLGLFIGTVGIMLLEIK